MSVFETKTITLRDGAVVTRRSADEVDAQRLIDYLDQVRRETDGIMFNPADDLPTLDEERKWVRGVRDNDGSVQIAAEVDDRLVALAGMDCSKRVRQRHSAGVGISIRDGWRDRGLGTALMRELVDWARAHPELEQLTLCVFHDNPRAHAVYRKVGFMEDGRLPRRAKRHGRFVDFVEMSLWLKAAGVLP